MLAASLDNAAVSFGDFLISECAWNPKIDAEIAGADQEHIHSLECSNFIRTLDRTCRFEHHDRESVVVDPPGGYAMVSEIVRPL